MSTERKPRLFSVYRRLYYHIFFLAQACFIFVCVASDRFFLGVAVAPSLAMNQTFISLPPILVDSLKQKKKKKKLWFSHRRNATFFFCTFTQLSFFPVDFLLFLRRDGWNILGQYNHVSLKGLMNHHCTLPQFPKKKAFSSPRPENLAFVALNSLSSRRWLRCASLVSPVNWEDSALSRSPLERCRYMTVASRRTVATR